MAQNAAGDQLDDLFDYDVDTELPDLNIDLDPPTSKRGAEKGSSSRKVNLGIDEEVKIRRVRPPAVKLDAERYAFFWGISSYHCD